MSESGTLFVIATPIGNLGDISHRALDTLQRVNIVYAEDTRVTNKLLEHYGIQANLQSLHDFNESKRISTILSKLYSGMDIGLVSDAGTPLISDPGYKLITAARQEGIQVRSVPGPSAVVAAISIAGIACDRFTFEGFIPKSASDQENLFKQLRYEERTQAFYDSPKRILSSIETMQRFYGNMRKASLLREISKQYEEHVCGTLGEIHQQLLNKKEEIKGEIVLVVEGNTDTEKSEHTDRAALLLEELEQHISHRDAVQLVAKHMGVARNKLYSIGIDKKNEKS